MKNLVLLLIAMSMAMFSFGQTKGMLKAGAQAGIGYAIGNNQGIGLGAGAELEYNLTENVPMGLYGRIDMYGLQFMFTGGFNFSYVSELAADRYFKAKAHIGGSILPDATNPMMGMNLGLGLYYEKYFADNLYFYIGPAYNGVFDGLDKKNTMHIPMLDGGIGVYLR
jgi:hypothetical protein